MESINESNLLNILENYDYKDINFIKKVYDYAFKYHDSQLRESGDSYITHPLNVACILAKLNADRDTICAALLHDIIEDTNVTYEDLLLCFNEQIAKLVDGVTKYEKKQFNSRDDYNSANTRKIIMSMTKDIRIIIIKLVDRLHNMRTLGFKSEFKQYEKSIETLEIFVPLAYHIKANKIGDELKNLSLKYLKLNQNDKYKLKINYFKIYNTILEIEKKLDNFKIANRIEFEMKQNIDVIDNSSIANIKIILNNDDDYYNAINILQNKVNNQKYNLAIKNFAQVIINEINVTVKTLEVNEENLFGLISYWTLYGNDAFKKMNFDLKKNYEIFKIINEINENTDNDNDFVNVFKKTKLKENITRRNIYE